jgi:hypothetical protein
MSEPRIQLWTDDADSEFAIFLNSNYMIRTTSKVKYTKLIDESICLQGFNYDWKHTLSQWVNYLFGNQLTLPHEIEISNSQQGLTGGTKIEPKHEHKTSKHYSLLTRSNKKRLSKPKPKLKPKLIECHFCKLKFFIDEERNEHEKFWHSAKLTAT